MKTITHNSVMPRVARMLLAVVLAMGMPLMSWAQEFVTDVMLVGAETQSQKNSLLNKYKEEGWTVADYDLNKGCGQKSDYVYLLYKTKGNIDGFSHGYVTGFYIRTGTNYPDELNVSGVNYKLVPYVGTGHFVEMKGDLNSNAGGAYIHLYYTEAILEPEMAVTSIYFDANAAGGVPADGGTGPNGYDLNKGVAGSAYIYMHFTTGSYHKDGKPMTYDLSEITQDLTLGDQDCIKGTLRECVKVAIADGATVTFLNSKIYLYSSDDTPWAGITCEGDATIIITGSNYIEGLHTLYPGIYVPVGKTLTIKGDGRLVARSGGSRMFQGRAAGIGGGRKLSCGNIVIEGGEIYAMGNSYSAAIGGGHQAECGNITIGRGITRIDAETQNNLNPIGAGLGGTCGTVTISDNLNDEFGYDGYTRVLYPFVVPDEPEWDGNLDKLKAGYPTYYATGKDGMTITGTLSILGRFFIAPGATVKLKDMKISHGSCLSPGITCEGDATIILEGNSEVWGGDGNSPGIQVGPAGTTLTIKGDGILTAGCGTASQNESYHGTGIGGSAYSKGSVGNIVIEGGTINAIGSENGAGIGAGQTLCGDITIKGGVVHATGGSFAPGIGAGTYSCGNISILGGTVYAAGGKDGICTYHYATPSDITIANEIDLVVSTRGSSSYQFFNVGSVGTLSIGSAITCQEDGNTCTLIGLGLDDGIQEIKNEELRMTEEGGIYNLSGQRLSKMQKGINIIDGKKILVK